MIGQIDKNPFDVLDATEINVDFFVEAFSDVLVKNAAPLFAVGNVVLQGMQGCGKSMLLGLLNTEVRLAYAEQHKTFPAKATSGTQPSFISATVNLSQEGVAAFGHRFGSLNKDTNATGILFGDYLNYAIVLNLLDAIQQLILRAPDNLRLEIQINPEQLDKYAISLAEDPSWFGALGDVSTFNSLLSALKNRLNEYRSFLNFNSRELSQNILESKSEAGRPIIAAATLLKKMGVIPKSTNIFVVIDQFEELIYQKGTLEQLEEPFRRVVNTMLAARSPAVFYRIGTRGHTWKRDLRVYGSERKLEADRDYKIINLDVLLRSSEHTKGAFHPLANDVLSKRLKMAGYQALAEGDTLLNLFGSGLEPAIRAREYAGKSPARAVRIENNWPENFKDYLLELVKVDPLEARFAEAWARQRGKGHIVENEQDFMAKPWRKSPWWTKERGPQALVQIAGRCQQALRWSGKQEILSLSGGNILVFLAICRQIWDAWIRSSRGSRNEGLTLPIPNNIQSTGILNASDWWIDKVIPSGFKGDSRQKFVRQVGRVLSVALYDDLAMSYPGNSGFSISLNELMENETVERELGMLADHGDLYEVRHTTKNRSKEHRLKWYPAPIICPSLRLPHQRIKEPMYTTASKAAEWLISAELLEASQLNKSIHTQNSAFQPGLFDGIDNE